MASVLVAELWLKDPVPRKFAHMAGRLALARSSVGVVRHGFDGLPCGLSPWLDWDSQHMVTEF